MQTQLANKIYFILTTMHNHLVKLEILLLMYNIAMVELSGTSTAGPSRAKILPNVCRILPLRKLCLYKYINQ